MKKWRRYANAALALALVGMVLAVTDVIHGWWWLGLIAMFLGYGWLWFMAARTYREESQT